MQRQLKQKDRTNHFLTTWKYFRVVFILWYFKNSSTNRRLLDGLTMKIRPLFLLIDNRKKRRFFILPQIQKTSSNFDKIYFLKSSTNDKIFVKSSSSSIVLTISMIFKAVSDRSSFLSYIPNVFNKCSKVTSVALAIF